MSDATTTEVVPAQQSPQKEIGVDSGQKDTSRFSKLRNVASKADPRRLLEHFAKPDQEQLTPDQKKAAGVFITGMALIKDHGVDAATFIIPAVIATLPVFLGAPHLVTAVAQETAIGATGALMGVDVGKTVRAASGEKNSKKATAVDAALGAATMMGIGHVAHVAGGDTFRAGVALADEPLAPPVRLAARAVKRGIEAKKAKAAASVPAEAVGQE